MKKSLKNSIKKFNDFFSKEPTAEMQSWSLLNDFYHLLITYMDKNQIKRSKLANKLGVSRSAISQLFNEQPNISLKKISDIANSIGLKLKITSEQIELPLVKEKYTIVKLAPSIFFDGDLEKPDEKEKNDKLEKSYDSNYEVHYTKDCP